MKNNNSCKFIFSLIYLLLFTFYLLPFLSCSFDYGNQGAADEDMPDIIMDDVEYVRMRAADPQARLLAERVERYEDRRLMKMKNVTFEQFGTGEEVNAFGMAGSASFEIDTGDIRMSDGVRIEIDTEDIILETNWLDWKDEARILSSGEEEEVRIFQENGTVFSGIGFHADAWNRSWEFSGTVSGTYIHSGNEEDEDAAEEIILDEVIAVEELTEVDDDEEDNAE
ncbi:MAG: LPS export ABC transporter periplasmic protein LptC [Treponema sp.]|nr:LPS export ABC transporter periplasmic protein LptC [Treponema sp.]